VTVEQKLRRKRGTVPRREPSLLGGSDKKSVSWHAAVLDNASTIEQNGARQNIHKEAS
jgi:hypothetical protein